MDRLTREASMVPMLRYGELLPAPRGGFGPRATAHYELIVVSQGSTRSTVDGVQWDPIGPSAVALLHPGQEITHEFDAEAGTITEAWWVHVPPAIVPPDLAGRLGVVPRMIPLSDQLFRLTFALMRLSSSTLSTVEQMGCHAALEILWCYVGDAERADAAAKRGGRPDTIELAQAYIREHLREPMTLEAIAAAADSSTTNLIRLFNVHVGETPMAYMWHRRVGLGIQLLEETGLTIGEIAERAGFRTVYHFSRTIKAHLGMTPTQVRLRAWKGPNEEPPDVRP